VNGPPLTLLTWFLAVLPIVLLLGLMVGFKWGGATSGPASWLLSVVIAFAFFGASPSLLTLSSLRGLVVSLNVLYIIWPALLLYHIANGVGALESIGLGISALTRDRILQLLILGFAFPSFLQGVAGFGVPVAVVAPLLIGLGFHPIEAAVIPLVGHAWAVTLGSLATSFQALVAVTGLPSHPLGLWVSIFLGFSCLVTGFLVAHIHAGFQGIRDSWILLLTFGGVMAGIQFFLAYLDYWVIASFAAGAAGLLVGLAFVAILRFKRVALVLSTLAPIGQARMGLHTAFAPYYLLIGVVTVATLLPPIKTTLNRVILTFPFPEMRTALGWVTNGGTVSINIFGHPGALLLYAALLAYLLYRWAGFWKAGQGLEVLKRTIRHAITTSIGVMAMIMMSSVMQDTGMTFLLARGTTWATGRLYPFFVPFIGLLGCFLTGNNVNSNILFGAFQRDAALLLKLNPTIMAALQSTGGSLGSMVAPAKVLLACAIAGLAGKEGEVMRQAFRYCLFLVALVGVLGWAILVDLREIW